MYLTSGANVRISRSRRAASFVVLYCCQRASVFSDDGRFLLGAIEAIGGSCPFSTASNGRWGNGCIGSIVRDKHPRLSLFLCGHLSRRTIPTFGEGLSKSARTWAQSIPTDVDKESTG